MADPCIRTPPSAVKNSLVIESDQCYLAGPSVNCYLAGRSSKCYLAGMPEVLYSDVRGRPLYLQESVAPAASNGAVSEASLL